MAQDNCDGMAGFNNAAFADYAVEIQFFDTADRPEAHVTLPLALFADQSSPLESSVSLGRWLK
jgi:hypothetical protein